VEDQSSLLQNAMQEDSFEVVMRGYNKRQVDDYVLQCQHHLRDLAQRLALAEQEVERVRVEAATAIEKAASKPVHEEVSERLSQILRLASEEAERERANAANEIAALRAAALAETQSLRELAQREVGEMRRQAVTETDALREQTRAEVQALREQATAESHSLLRQAELEAADERERAQSEADRLLSEARAAADRDLAEARAQARHLEYTARAQSDQLVRAAQERADVLDAEAERRTTAINTVLGARLDMLTSTHGEVVARLCDLRVVLVDVLRQDDEEGPFEVPPPPAETLDATVAPAEPVLSDAYVQTAGEVAAAYEAQMQAAAQAQAEQQAPEWVTGDPQIGEDSLDLEEVGSEQVISLKGEPAVTTSAVPAVPLTSSRNRRDASNRT
jgi:cell division septum initiation protein DivIVA